jgi:pectate lyase
VNGKIKLDPEQPIEINSNKVIDGRGRKIVVHGGFKIPSGTRNVVMTDIAVTFSDYYPSGKISRDLIGIWGVGGKKLKDYTTQNIWLNHLDLSKGTDGAIDIRGGTNITISSCRIHDHEKALLIARDANHGHTPDTRVTMYRNYFSNVTRRQPQMHFGKLDFFNNVIDDWWEFGVGVFEDAEAIVENNFFSRKKRCIFDDCTNPNSPTNDRVMRASKLAVTYEWNDYPPGNGRVSGSVFTRKTEAPSRNQSHVFKRDSYYKLRPAKMDEKLAQKIRKEAGPRGRDKYCIDLNRK